MSKTFYKALGKVETWPNITGATPGGITYDDVLLVPQPDTKVKSRRLPDVSVKLGPYTLTKPIISAPMDTITGERMIRRLDQLGAIGVLPRDKEEKVLDICRRLSQEKVACIYSVGLRGGLELAKKLKKAGAKVILVDVAHGGMEQVVETASSIAKKLKLTVITGNIVSYTQAKLYLKNGLKIARVGVGPGGLCTTRMVAGSGYPQLAAVWETAESGITVIADGGIKKPGDMAKALAAGASLVMIGSMFAGTEETPGDVVHGKKRARGQASAGYMKDNNIELGEFRAAEGKDVMVDAKGSVEYIVNELIGGLRSAMTYAGAKDLAEFRVKAQFVLVSHSTRLENDAHINGK
ncbi:MAG TPA: guanosine monophosphate reductase [Patescibacteria group bacterium]|nr:guanosine monophosphate reductase [Patescibacteria group bacterium]